MSQTNDNVFGNLSDLFGTAEDLIIRGADVARDIGIISDETYDDVERRFEGIDSERREYEDIKAGEKFAEIWAKVWPVIATTGIVLGGVLILRKL